MQENNIFENENTSGENSSPEVKEIPETAGVVVPNVNYVQYIPYGFTPKTFEEKQGIRKAANVMSISLLLMLGISLLWSFVYIFVMLGLGFSYEKAVGILEDPAILQVLQIVLSAFLFTVPFIIVYKIGRYRISDLVPFEKPAKGDFLPLFLLGVSFCSFANIAVSYAGAIFEAFGINYEVDYGENPEGFFGFMLSFIATVIVPALVEEFACRGLLLGSLRKFGDGFAVLVSAIMFGIMHGNFEQMPFAFLVGLVLGFITVKSGTIWIAAAVHGFNNFISVFFDYFMDGFSMQVQNISYLIFLSFSLLVGILGICLLRKRDSEFFKFTPSDTETGEKRKYKLFFTTPLVIIFIIISVLESLVYLSKNFFEEEFLMYNYDSVAAGITTFIGIYLIVMLFACGVSLVLYILQGVGLYEMGKRLNLNNPWISFVPFANVYALGRIAQRYIKRDGTQSAKFSVILLALYIAEIVLLIAFFIFFFVAIFAVIANAELAVETESEMVMSMFASFIPVIIFYFLLMAVAITYSVTYYVALWRVFAIYNNSNATLYLVLSIFFSFLAPIFLFVLRKNNPAFDYATRMGFPVIMPEAQPVEQPTNQE